MTPTDLDALDALISASTPGPWADAGHGDMTAPNANFVLVANDLRPRDLAFISAIRTAAPKLVAEIRSLRRALATAEHALAFAEPIAAQLARPARQIGEELYTWCLIVGAEPATLTRTHIRDAIAALVVVSAALDSK